MNRCSGLAKQDPRGNVALLAFRVLERIAPKHMSREEWEGIAPLAEQLLQRRAKMPRRAKRAN